MTATVLLNLGRGSLHQGFPLVTLQIRTAEGSPEMQLTGSLPPAPSLLELYQRWQLLYDLLYKVRTAGFRQGAEPLQAEEIWIEESDITHVSEADFLQVCDELRQHLDRWLDAAGFRPLERQLRMHLHPQQVFCLILQTEDPQVRKLPWSVWQLFQDYTFGEAALSPLSFAPKGPQPVRTQPLRILAILGDTTDIDITADRQLLETQADAELCLLAEPSRAEFDHHLWDQRGWDILFFAGHSSSWENDARGQIFLNPEETLTIPQFSNALKRAIERGLHLAIFNSCEGLGLASQLGDLNIPEIIVMREPVPDGVAQAFLKHFLTTFAAGKPLYLAVREARERLQGIETDYPGASWLPVLFQNPAVAPLAWRSAYPRQESGAALGPAAAAPRLYRAKPAGLWKSLLLVLRTGLLASALVMGGRWLGLLQPLELQAFDRLMRLRPAEAMDDRLLLVTIDSEDKAYQVEAGMPMQGSLSDRALEQMIKTLAAHQPAVVGLDIYRDGVNLSPAAAAARARAVEQRGSNFIDICQVGQGAGNPDEIAPPAGVPLENVGFSDLAFDSDLVVRRQIFGMAPGERCASQVSFSFLIARRYLANQGVEFSRPARDRFQVGPARFQKVNAHSGGYHRLAAGGFEVMTNYRDAVPIAAAISLRALLDGSRAAELPELVGDKIVLVGNVDAADKDYHQTPYSPNAVRSEVPGVVIQAHMVSHLISAALDDRPTISWWPQWGDGLWVLGWSVLGGSLVSLAARRPRLLGLIGVAVLVGAGTTCFLGLWLGGLWLPLVPTVLGVTATAVAVRLEGRIRES